MLTGTHHFRSTRHASRYYDLQGDGGPTAVADKLAAGEIAIGPPDLKRYPAPADWW